MRICVTSHGIHFLSFLFTQYDKNVRNDIKEIEKLNFTKRTMRKYKNGVKYKS